MPPRVVKKPTLKDIKSAGKIIRNGGIVVFPTETVYGLGANAYDPEACRKIFRIKKRPSENPLIVHIAEISALKKIAKNIPPVANKLISKFWPGPVTIVFKRKKTLPDVVTAGLNTVAVRMPSNKIALALIKSAGVPVAAPSANISGAVSPTAHRHIEDDFRDEKDIDIILAGGNTMHGLESTIVDVTRGRPLILRLGAVSVEEIEKVLGAKVRICGDGGKILSPGMYKKHYRPRTPFFVFCETGRMKEFLKTHQASKIGVLAETGSIPSAMKNRRLYLKTYRNISELSRNLYGWLRDFDKMGLDFILAARVDERGLGRTINDRFKRSATKIFGD